MQIIKGRINGTNLDNKYAIISERLSVRSLRFVCELDGNVISVDIIDQKKARGLTGAAGGAVLGFLLAGPAGTVIGGAAGAGGKNRTVAAVSFTNGDSIYGDVSPEELARLRAAQAATMMQGIRSSQAPASPSSDSPTPEHSDKVPPVIKGRSKNDVPLPAIPQLEKFHSIAKEIGPVATAVVNDTAALLYEYNAFKWRHLDKLIEHEHEILAVTKLAIARACRFLIDAPEIESKITQISSELEKFNKQLEAKNGEIESENSDLERAGLFSRGKIKKNLATLQQDRNSVMKKIRSLNSELSKVKEKQPSDHAYSACADGNSQVIAFAETVLGEEAETALKKPRGRMPTKKDYYKIFRDSKLAVEIAEAEISAANQSESQLPTTAKSVKDRLLELNSLLEEGLISDEEYKEKKEALLADL
jgi:hypothetical protein